MNLSTSYLTHEEIYVTETAIGDHWLANTGPHDNPTTLPWLNTLDHNSRNRIAERINGEVILKFGIFRLASRK